MNQKNDWSFFVGDHVSHHIANILKTLGWTQLTNVLEPANLRWKNCIFNQHERKQAKNCPNGLVKLNHINGITSITEKDKLARNLRRLNQKYGSIFKFFPESFLLPSEYKLFLQSFNKEPGLWICKPSVSSKGKGIKIIENIESLDYHESMVIQRYIHNPFTISNYKFDLRIYVCILSLLPLQIYIFNEGLVRFCCQPYQIADFNNLFIHLTNTSINNLSFEYSQEKPIIGNTSKWTLSHFFEYVDKNNNSVFSSNSIWNNIQKIIVLTILSLITPDVLNNDSSFCYELLGFDILLDNTGKCWLLEVNFSPQMTIYCPEDEATKIPLIIELVRLVFPSFQISNPISYLSYEYSVSKSLNTSWQCIFPNYFSSEQACYCEKYLKKSSLISPQFCVDFIKLVIKFIKSMNKNETKI